MSETNETKELKYTEEQVMNALLQLNPEERSILYSGNMNCMMQFANDEEFTEKVIADWRNNILTCTKAIESVLKLKKILLRSNNNLVNVGGRERRFRKIFRTK